MVVLTSVAEAGLDATLVRRALATPASNILSALLWLALLCTSAVQTFAQGGIPLWTNRYDGPGNFADSAGAVAVDSIGNVFVTGSGAYYDYVTIKYSSSLTQPSLSIARDGSGRLFIHHIGVPDLTYRLQRAASVSGPWSDVATNTAPASGLIEYYESTPPPGGAYYRAIQSVQD